MTASDVLTEARYKLSDSGSTRWSDAVLLRYLANAVQAVARVRPDLRLATASTLVTIPASISSTSTTLPFNENVKEPLGYLVAAMALDEDSGDQANANLAARYRQQANEALGVGA